MTLSVYKTWGELPIEIKELLSEEYTVEKIESIGAKQGLSIMEQGFLVRITANLLRGIIEPTVFVNQIADECDITREKAAYLAQEINRDIFSTVKDALRSVHSKIPAVPKLDPSLVTCLPKDMSPEAAAENKAPGNAPPASGSIFEQKLGGAFRMKGEIAASTGVLEPRPVVPPPPQALRPTQITPPPPPPLTHDPYRELPT